MAEARVEPVARHVRHLAAQLDAAVGSVVEGPFLAGHGRLRTSAQLTGVGRRQLVERQVRPHAEPRDHAGRDGLGRALAHERDHGDALRVLLVIISWRAVADRLSALVGQCLGL